MEDKMTSRQRVLAAIEHKPVDRMPIDLGCHYSSGISAFAYYNLRKYLGMSTDNIKIADPMQFLAKVDEDILEMFHIDCINLHPGFENPVVYNPREDYRFVVEESLMPEKGEEGSWILKHDGLSARMLKGGYFFDGDWIDGFNFREEETLDKLAKEAERIYHETDYFTMLIGFGAFFSMDIEFMLKMIQDKDEIHAINKERLKNQISDAAKVIKKMGKHIQAIAINSDLGTQNGPIVNPKLYEELCVPYIKEFCSFIHNESDLKVFMHSCGSIEPMIGPIADAGVDILNPVQISANNMEPEKLKERYGDKITFWGGGCDTQNVLATATPDEVAQNVKYLSGILKKDSGFVFNQVHNIMGDVPPENIIAMLEAAYEQ